MEQVLLGSGNLPDHRRLTVDAPLKWQTLTRRPSGWRAVEGRSTLIDASVFHSWRQLQKILAESLQQASSQGSSQAGRAGGQRRLELQARARRIYA